MVDATGASQQTIALEVNIEDLSLPVDKAYPCSFILNQLIIDVLWHALRRGPARTARNELGKTTAYQLLLGAGDSGIESGGASIRATIRVWKSA